MAGTGHRSGTTSGGRNLLYDKFLITCVGKFKYVRNSILLADHTEIMNYLVKNNGRLGKGKAGQNEEKK